MILCVCLYYFFVYIYAFVCIYVLTLRRMLKSQAWIFQRFCANILWSVYLYLCLPSPKARERLKAKFGASNGLSSGGKLGGVGSDPNYRAGQQGLYIDVNATT